MAIGYSVAVAVELLGLGTLQIQYKQYGFSSTHCESEWKNNPVKT